MGRFLFALVLLASSPAIRSAFIRCAHAFGFSIAVHKRILGWLRPWPLPGSGDAKM
jgi:hypothetical protein